jgi:Domain of unknown function (DUF4160)
MKLEKELAELQDAFMIDLFTRPARPNNAAWMELLIKKLQAIKIRMDGNKNHTRPHVHIDYGKEYHVASYAIDTGDRLVGNLDTKYDRAAREWIAGNRVKLFEAWELMQAGKTADPIAYELRGE